MKRVIALLMAAVLIFSLIPGEVFASEQEFVNIGIRLNGQVRQCKVIDIAPELMFSGEDLAAFGGYTYHIEGNNAFFTRGAKTIRVNMSRSSLVPYDGTDYSEHNKNIVLNTPVYEDEGIYYFPGSQLLPWLSVNCSVENGKLCILTDAVSIWDLVDKFNPEDYSFDFIKCCEELGENSKWVKALAGLQGFGIETIFGWLPSFGNNSKEEHDYYDIFEDMLQDQTCTQTSVDELMEDADKISEWMDWAEAMQVAGELPDEMKVIGAISEVISSAPMELSTELGLYLATIDLDNSEKLNALRFIVTSGYDFPDEMEAAAYTIYLEYSDRILGILGKGMDVLYEALKDLAGDCANDAFKMVMALIEFPGLVEADCAQGIRRVDYYATIAECTAKEYENYKEVISDIGIQNTRSSAYLYLYSVEQNWRTMSEYAKENGEYELAAEYGTYADSAELMASMFLMSAYSQLNDSPQYAAAEPRRKQGYTDKLKEMFSAVVRQSSIIDFLGVEISLVVEQLGRNYIDEYMDGGHCYTYNDVGAVFFFEDANGNGTTVNTIYCVSDIDYGYGFSANMTYPEITELVAKHSKQRIPQPERYYSMIEERWEFALGFTISDIHYSFAWADDPDVTDSYEMVVSMPFSVDVETFSDDIQAWYGKASHTEFASCFETNVLDYPSSIVGFLTEASVDLDRNGKIEKLALISMDNSIYLQIYGESQGKYVLLSSKAVTSLSYCSQQNISIFYNENMGTFLLFVDEATRGAFTGNDSRNATIYELNYASIDLLCQANEDDYGTAKDDIPTQLELFSVPYAINCARIDNITPQSQYKELLEIEHRTYGADPLGGWLGREHHLQLITPEVRNRPVDDVQTWTITVQGYQGWTEYREETWIQEFKTGNVYTIRPTWKDGVATDYSVLWYTVDTQERIIEIGMDYPEGDSYWSGLVLDLVENTYYGLEYTTFDE